MFILKPGRSLSFGLIRRYFRPLKNLFVRKINRFSLLMILFRILLSRSQAFLLVKLTWNRCLTLPLLSSRGRRIRAAQRLEKLRWPRRSVSARWAEPCRTRLPRAGRFSPLFVGRSVRGVIRLLLRMNPVSVLPRKRIIFMKGKTFSVLFALMVIRLILMRFILIFNILGGGRP